MHLLTRTPLTVRLRGLKTPNAILLVCLVLISGLAIASGQGEPHKRRPRAPLEKYDDPPAPFPLRGIGVSPGMVSRYDTFTSYQVNVNALGQNITGDAANEPSISVDPTNHSKMTIGWRQFNNVSSNFRQGGYAYSNDGGVHWTFPGVLEANVFRSDPVTDSDETGTFFYLSLLQTFCENMYRSTSGGQFWTELQPTGQADGGDKQWFTIDKTNGPGHGFQYQASDGINCDNTGVVEFQRSTDGGVTWQAPIGIPPLNDSPYYGTLDVDTNGNVFIGGEGFSLFYCVRSSNAQIGSQTPTFDRVTTVNMGGVLSGGGINPAGLDGQVFLAVDHSGTATNNNIYMLASVQPSGRSTTDVMFVRSTDGGLTFSAPRRINDDPVNPSKWHWFGTFSVAPNGRLDSVWLDTRNAANNTDSQLFYSYSLDAGITWSPNVAVSNPFNPFLGYPNQSKIGDYMTIVSDNAGADVAYAATFNSEQDVYHVRVAPAAPVALGAVSRKTHGGAGAFDVPLPLTGGVGIECRRGSGANFDEHQIIVTFANPITVQNANVTSGTGSVGGFSVSGTQATVNLTGVSNAQTITVTLAGVNDGIGFGDVTVSMGLLLGDTNGNAAVSAADISQTKSKTGQTTDATNFREDLNVSGSITSADISQVKSSSGTSLP